MVGKLGLSRGSRGKEGADRDKGVKAGARVAAGLGARAGSRAVARQQLGLAARATCGVAARPGTEAEGRTRGRVSASIRDCSWEWGQSRAGGRARLGGPAVPPPLRNVLPHRCSGVRPTVWGPLM